MALSEARGVAVYLTIAILTFGYAATNPRSTVSGGDAAMAHTLSAGLWPLYWSWEIFDLGRAALGEKDSE